MKRRKAKYYDFKFCKCHLQNLQTSQFLNPLLKNWQMAKITWIMTSPQRCLR